MNFFFKAFFNFIFLWLLPFDILSQDMNNLMLMPFPKKIVLKQGKFIIHRNFVLSIKGNPGSKVFSAGKRFLRQLDSRTGLFLIPDSVNQENNPGGSNMIIEVDKPAEVKSGEDESYKLIINENKILLKAPTDLGALHGMQTLFQLLEADENGYYFPALEINDEPRFPWRGLLIDVSRHFMPVDVIKRNLDGMAAVKLNVLHLHLTDDQGFRIECKIFPRLHELGSDGLYYTQNQIREILQYANERGIRVYPEFDMPGHTTSWFAGYPEYASAPGPYKIERGFGVKDPAFNPVNEKLYEFLKKFFGEMSALFPDEYIHIGGDENNGVQWDANDQIQKFMKEKGFKDNHQLQAYFINRIQEILSGFGKKMIGWDEILHRDIEKNIVIQSWRGRDALIQSAKQGYNGILSYGYYIDLMQSAAYHYLNDPLPENSGLSPEEASRILGGEAAMWSEWVTEENIDSRIWPRTAAIAERFWSPGEFNNADYMYVRLDKINILLEEFGLRHISFQPVMLRRLAGSQSIDALTILTGVTKPLEGYERQDIAKYGGFELMSYSPFTRFVDAVTADPKPARDFNKAVDKYLKTRSADDANKLSKFLITWKDNHKELLPVIKNSPILKEIEPLSVNLSSIAQLGLEALYFLQDKSKPDDEWINNKNRILEDCGKPYGTAELAVIRGIRNLVQAVQPLKGEN
jgi:hexosaminidase